jgi:SAM-dependent methyltransferase
VGIDISEDMIKKALIADPQGEYLLVKDNNFDKLKKNYYDLVLSVFTFDNIPGRENRVFLLSEIKKLIHPEGKIILLDSTPELYVNEWASFSTKEFPENFTAKSGDIVKTIMNDVFDRRPVEDILWTEEDYRESFVKAGLKLETTYTPLGEEGEPYKWINEIKIAPWRIFQLAISN